MPEFLELSDAEKRLVELVVQKYYTKLTEGPQLDTPEKCVEIYKGLKTAATEAMRAIAPVNGRISDALLKSDVAMVDFITSEHITKYLNTCFQQKVPDMHSIIFEAYTFRQLAAIACKQNKNDSLVESENERAFK